MEDCSYARLGTAVFALFALTHCAPPLSDDEGGRVAGGEDLADATAPPPRDALRRDDGGGEDGPAGEPGAKRDGGDETTPADARVDGAPPAPRPDAGSSPGRGNDGGDAPWPIPPAGRVPMFLAVGPGLRTTISCDDGRSWVENRMEKETDDDFSHDETNVHGAVFADGRFYYPAGWGFSTTRVLSSEDGVTWERLYLGGAHQSNTMTTGDGVLLFGEGGTVRRSADQGKTWKAVSLPVSVSHQRLAYGDTMGGRFVAGGREKRHVYSVDRGMTWKASEGDGGHFPVYGGGVFVSFQRYGGSLARSTDGGATWRKVSCCGNLNYANVVFWDGSRFLLYQNDAVWGSGDGAEWTKLSGLTTGPIETVARNPVTGTYVAARAGRPVSFFHSPDGLEWTRVPAGAYDPRGAEIKYVTFGYGRPSPKCPLR